MCLGYFDFSPLSLYISPKTTRNLLFLLIYLSAHFAFFLNSVVGFHADTHTHTQTRCPPLLFVPGTVRPAFCFGKKKYNACVLYGKKKVLIQEYHTFLWHTQVYRLDGRCFSSTCCCSCCSRIAFRSSICNRYRSTAYSLSSFGAVVATP